MVNDRKKIKSLRYASKGLALRWLTLVAFVCICLLGHAQSTQTPNRQKDAELLGKALEYFASQKYHECLFILQGLDLHYRLNPRYKAYLGVCYYYAWDYENAVKHLSYAIPKLVHFAPHERSFYYWAIAESYFNLQNYDQAIPCYQDMLKLCYDKERAEACYRLGFCYLFREEWANAWSYFYAAQMGFQQYRPNDEQARIVQIGNMLKALNEKVVTEALAHIGINKTERK